MYYVDKTALDQRKEYVPLERGRMYSADEGVPVSEELYGRIMDARAKGESFFKRGSRPVRQRQILHPLTRSACRKKIEIHLRRITRELQHSPDEDYKSRLLAYRDILQSYERRLLNGETIIKWHPLPWRSVNG